MINERKKYIEQCKDTFKDIIKIRLLMWGLKKNCRKEEEQPLYPLCETEDGTTEYVLLCGRVGDRKHRNIKDNAEEEQQEVCSDIQREQEKKRRKKKGSLGERSSLGKMKKNRN